MKTKYLAYSKCKMNQVVTHWAELEKINDKVYTFLDEKSPHSEAYDRLGVVLKVETVYYLEGIYDRQLFQKHDVGKLGSDAVDNFRAAVEYNMEHNLHVSILTIKIYEALGWDTSPLLQYCEQRRLKQAATYQEKQLAKKAAEQQAVEANNRHLAAVNRSFHAGEFIKSEDFITLCTQEGIEIPLRTHGTFNNSVIEVNKDGRIRFCRQKGKREPLFDGCRKVIATYTMQTVVPISNE